MKIYLLAGILAALCLQGQAQDSTIKPLTIGDAVPDITFTNLINYPTKTAKLSDFKGKLVILDFWATWCGSCIAKFPEMHSMQQEFNDDLQIILVNSNSTGDTKASISQFLNKRAELSKPVSLPIVPEEVIIKGLFPHNSLPHYIWIKDQKVMAITGPEEITSFNIKTAGSSALLSLQTKNDVDRNKLLYLSNTAPTGKLYRYSIGFKGILNNFKGGGSAFSLRMQGDTIQGVLFGNRTLLSIYTKLAAELVPGFDNDRARIIDLTGDEALKNHWAVDKGKLAEWRKENLYTIEIYAPGKSKRELYNDVLAELNTFTDYHTNIQNISTKCLVLQLVDHTKKPGWNKDSLKPPDHSRVFNSISLLKEWMRSDRFKSHPIIDSTAYRGYIDVYINTEAKEVAAIHTELLKNNLSLTERYLKIPMLVISKKNNH